MNITEQIREYVLNAEEPPLYSQMREDLGLDHPTALNHFMQLFRQDFCKAMSIEGELRIFRVVTRIPSCSETADKEIK